MSALPGSDKNDPIVLIGTDTEPNEGTSEGVHVYRMDPSSGELLQAAPIQGVANVSFMEVHPRSGLVYAASNADGFEGNPGGVIHVLSIDPSSGEFSVLNKQSSGGANPAYISIERTGRFALVANYKSGTIAMLPIQDDGTLLPASDVVQHDGSGPDPERQDGPHPHCVIPDPTNQFAIAVDLGIDKLLVYRMDLEQGKLHKHSEVQVDAGAGPRHLIFNAEGQYAYLVNELNSTVIVYHYHAEEGSFTKLQTITTLPLDFTKKNLCGDIHLSKDERHLYVSNRGLDNIVCFRVAENSGHLSYQSQVSSNGREPGFFAIDPDGCFLIAAHQRSNNVVVFKIDTETGELSPSGYEAHLSMPVHVLFVGSSDASNSLHTIS